MAQTAIAINLKGAEKLRKALRDPKFVSGPASAFVRKSAFEIQRNAVKFAPSDTSRLRNSITPQFEDKGLKALVGTNVKYAQPLEFGSRPHWPPRGSLKRWARRHGFLVDRKTGRRRTADQADSFVRFLISKRPKSKSRRAFLGPALRRAGQQFIKREFNVLMRGIATRFERSA